MRTRRMLAAVLLAALVIAPASGRQARALPVPLSTLVDPVIAQIWSAFDLAAAQGHVDVIGRTWRLPANPGYDAAIDRIERRLAGVFRTATTGTAGTAGTAGTLHLETYAPATRGWDHTVGTLALVHDGRPDEIVLSREKERLALCINSFSTAPGGVVAPVIDVGRGDREEDYAGKNVTGAVVLGDADVSALWRRAVTMHGAIGVVSTALGKYVSPDAPGATPTPRDQWDILQWGSVPYDEARKGFGFKSSPRAAATLRRALGAGPASVRVTISSTFTVAPTRTLVAEIPGRVAPQERVVIAAHLQEPGANDNASGVATLAELARAIAIGIDQKKIPAPARTLTFLFLNEISGSRQWLQDHPQEAKQVKYMMSMDMTGEDVTKTGGSFLIERWPDPGAVWERPWDPHSEWGGSNVRADSLKGDLINDLHLAICERVATRSRWVVKSNPYEGGSDHTVFGGAGVPALLNWHFTDRYYHTNFDTPDKTSAAEMRNVGVAVATTAWVMSSADERASIAVAELVANAGRARLALEQSEGTRLAAAAADPAVAQARETQIQQAWRKWYREAVQSVARLQVGSVTEGLRQALDRLAAPFAPTTGAQ